MFVGAPFGKSPQLAAIASTFLAILFAIVALVLKGGSTLSLIYTLIFPPGFFIFVILAICGYESRDTSPILSQGDPDNHTRIAGLFVIALIDIFLYPLLAYFVENIRYNASNPDSGLLSRFRHTATPPRRSRYLRPKHAEDILCGFIRWQNRHCHRGPFLHCPKNRYLDPPWYVWTHVH